MKLRPTNLARAVREWARPSSRSFTLSPAALLEFATEAAASARTIRRAAAVDGRKVCSVTVTAPTAEAVEHVRSALSEALKRELGDTPAVWVEIRGETVKVVAIKFVPRT